MYFAIEDKVEIHRCERGKWKLIDETQLNTISSGVDMKSIHQH